MKRLSSFGENHESTPWIRSRRRKFEADAKAAELIRNETAQSSFNEPITTWKSRKPRMGQTNQPLESFEGGACPLWIGSKRSMECHGVATVVSVGWSSYTAPSCGPMVSGVAHRGLPRGWFDVRLPHAARLPPVPAAPGKGICQLVWSPHTRRDAAIKQKRPWLECLAAP